MANAKIQWIDSLDNSIATLYVVKKKRINELSSILTKEDLAVVKQSIKNEIFFSAFNKQGVQKIILVQDTKRSKEALRIQGARALKWIQKQKITTIQILSLTGKKGFKDFLEGFLLSSYSFDKYKKTKKEKLSISILSTSVDTKTIQNCIHVIEATCTARTLVNEPLSYLTAQQFSKEMKKTGKNAGFEVEVWQQKQIEDEGLNGLLAVNKGSFDPATFNILTYKPANAVNKKPIVLVGKGIVYDTGGLSLKPTANSMDFMKADMGGAATVVGAFEAIAKNKLPIHIIGLIPCTDNRPGNKAYAPGDVVTMYSGKTVEVLNTDAEGRMVLADALHYAKKFDPELVLDFATLTGAAAFTTAGKATSMMGNASKKTRDLFYKSGFETYERIFEFPMWEEYGDMIKSDIADIKNIGGKGAGMITAGKFLEHFTDYPWLHFDIAGCAYSQSPDSYRGKGGTGFGVRLVHSFIEKYIKK